MNFPFCIECKQNQYRKRAKHRNPLNAKPSQGFWSNKTTSLANNEIIKIVT